VTGINRHSLANAAAIRSGLLKRAQAYEDALYAEYLGDSRIKKRTEGGG
jgi:hypothetical protein